LRWLISSESFIEAKCGGIIACGFLAASRRREFEACAIAGLAGCLSVFQLSKMAGVILINT